MFFSKLARLLAILAFVFGLLWTVLGILIATELLGPYQAALARYTTDLSSEAVIYQGIYAIVFAVALGTLAEMSFLIRKAFNPNFEEDVIGRG